MQYLPIFVILLKNKQRKANYASLCNNKINAVNIYRNTI